MPGIVYSVEVQYATRGDLIGPTKSLKQLQADTDKWNASLGRGATSFASGFDSAVSSVGGMMFDMAASVTSAFAKIGVAGFALATKAAFHFNEEMENTTSALAAIANANGLSSNFASAMQQSGDIVAQMRKDARDLPGEFRDLANIMTTMASPAAQMGKTLPEIEKLSAKMMTAGIIANIPPDVIAREAASLLSGTATHRMPLMNRLPFGMDAKTFNKLSDEERWKKMNETASKMDPALGTIKGNWTTIKSTGIDNIRQGLGFLGAPLFDSVKNAVSRFNQWAAGDGQAKMKGLGSQLRLELAYAIRGFEHGVQHWYPVIKTFGQHLGMEIKSAWASAAPLIHKASEGLERFMKDPQAIEKLESAAKTMLALKMGSSAMSMGMSIGAEGGPLGVAAAVLLGAAMYGLTENILDTSSAFHNFTVTHLSNAGRTLEEMKKNLVSTDGAFQALGAALAGIVDFGLAQLNQGMHDLNWVVQQVTTSFSAVGFVFDALVRGKAPPGFGANTGYDPNSQEAWKHRLTGILDINDLNPDEPIVNKHDFPDYNPAPKSSDDIDEVIKKIPNKVTNIHGGIHINVQGNQDPFRTAKATRELVADLANHPKVASVTNRGY